MGVDRETGQLQVDVISGPSRVGPNKVYVITAGRYSDYHIIAASTTRDGAEVLLGRLSVLGEGEESANIEEYPLDQIPRKEHAWRCNVNVKTGEVEREWEFDPMVWGDEVFEDQAAYWTAPICPGGVVSGMSARGPDVARKIAFDKRTQVLAEQAGV